MAHLAVVRGLTYTNLSQVYNRWLMPTYRTAFRWTGNRVDAEDATSWALHNVVGHLQLPEPVQMVDDRVVDAVLEAVARHWVERYGIERARCAEIYASEAPATLEGLFDDLTAEMRLLLVLRFLRRRSPATIAAQLHIRPEMARRRIIAALSLVAQRIGFYAASDEPPQADHLSAYIDDLIQRKRPLRYEALSEAWPPMVGASHLQAAIAGNSLPVQEFVRSLEKRLLKSPERRHVTDLRIWPA